MVRVMETEDRMAPFLLVVPSTFDTARGLDKREVRREYLLTSRWSIKFPDAPLSIRAFVSTFVLSCSCSSDMGTMIDLAWGLVQITGASRMGDLAVVLGLPFKNPK